MENKYMCPTCGTKLRLTWFGSYYCYKCKKYYELAFKEIN